MIDGTFVNDFISADGVGGLGNGHVKGISCGSIGRPGRSYRYCFIKGGAVYGSGGNGFSGRIDGCDL